MEYKTYHKIKKLLIILDSYAVTMRHDYNLMSEKERQDIYEHQLTITRALREITGVNAYRAKIEEELEQERLQLIEENKECVEEFISTISETLTSIKNPEYYRNYSVNKEATSGEDLFKVTIEHHPSMPPVELNYPNATNMTDQEKTDEFFSNKQIKWPKQGDKITFKGVQHFWFLNIIKAAQELLEVGKVYTVKKCEPFSSWVAVELEEVPEQRFTLSFFDY